MINLLTPTNNRVDVFSLCARWMQNQTYEGPVNWIVIDDGKEKVQVPKVKNWNIVHIQRPPMEGNSHAANLLEGLEHLKSDKVIMIEDDDYYHPKYVQLCAAGLEEKSIIGCNKLIKYSLPTKTYMLSTYNMPAPVAMVGTSFKGKIDEFKKICEEADPLAGDQQLLDVKLWGLFSDAEKGYYKNDYPIVVGLKGHVKNGITTKHERHLGTPDSNLNMLKKILREDIALYKPYL